MRAGRNLTDASSDRTAARHTVGRTRIPDPVGIGEDTFLGQRRQRPAGPGSRTASVPLAPAPVPPASRWPRPPYRRRPAGPGPHTADVPLAPAPVPPASRWPRPPYRQRPPGPGPRTASVPLASAPVPPASRWPRHRRSYQAWGARPSCRNAPPHSTTRRSRAAGRCRRERGSTRHNTAH